MPYIQSEIPFSGVTPASRHSSWTGAKAAASTRDVQRARYVDLLTAIGPLTDHDAAARLRCGVSSINSIRNMRSVRRLVQSCGHQEHVYLDPVSQQVTTTKRTLWGLR